MNNTAIEVYVQQQAEDLFDFGMLFGQVYDFLVGLSDTLPRGFLRGVIASPGLPDIALFGLSVWATRKLLTRLDTMHAKIDQGYLRPVPLKGDFRVDANGIIEDSDNFLPGQNKVRLTGINFWWYFASMMFWTFCAYAWDDVLSLFVALVFLILMYINKSRGYHVSLPHYVDLVSYGYGRTCNAALYHTLRSRLYHRFWLQYEKDREGLELFTSTLDAAFSVLKKNERAW